MITLQKICVIIKLPSGKFARTWQEDYGGCYDEGMEETWENEATEFASISEAKQAIFSLNFPNAYACYWESPPTDDDDSEEAAEYRDYLAFINDCKFYRAESITTFTEIKKDE